LGESISVADFEDQSSPPLEMEEALPSGEDAARPVSMVESAIVGSAEVEELRELQAAANTQTEESLTHQREVMKLIKTLQMSIAAQQNITDEEQLKREQLQLKVDQQQRAMSDLRDGAAAARSRVEQM
jgi:hypothetical protein